MSAPHAAECADLERRLTELETRWIRAGALPFPTCPDDDHAQRVYAIRWRQGILEVVTRQMGPPVVRLPDGRPAPLGLVALYVGLNVAGFTVSLDPADDVLVIDQLDVLPPSVLTMIAAWADTLTSLHRLLPADTRRRDDGERPAAAPVPP